MTHHTTHYADGTSLTMRMPFATYVTARAMCSDGVVRTVRIAPTADTFFSVPGRVSVKGKTAAGFVTVETREGFSTATDDDPAMVKFVRSDNRANTHMLPAGTYRADRHGVQTGLAWV